VRSSRTTSEVGGEGAGAIHEDPVEGEVAQHDIAHVRREDRAGVVQVEVQPLDRHVVGDDRHRRVRHPGRQHRGRPVGRGQHEPRFVQDDLPLVERAPGPPRDDTVRQRDDRTGRGTGDGRVDCRERRLRHEDGRLDDASGLAPVRLERVGVDEAGLATKPAGPSGAGGHAVDRRKAHLVAGPAVARVIGDETRIHRLVHVAIAVVVPTVALLRPALVRRPPGLRRAERVEPVQRAGALAHAALALPDAAQPDIEALVGLAIAVVVPAVARLGRWVRGPAPILTARRTGVEVEEAVDTRGDPASAVDTGAPGRGLVAVDAAGAAVSRIGQRVEVLVRGTVAVVVEGVARLRAPAVGAAAAIARTAAEAPGETLESAPPALPGALTDRPDREVLVGSAVAVVVASVAALHGGHRRRAGILAAILQPPVGVEQPGGTVGDDTDATDTGRRRVRRLADAAAEPAVGGVRLEIEPFVDAVVAVVVEPVAGLARARVHVDGRVVAVPATGRHAVAIAVEPVVDCAIAVVVRPVAGLRLREPGHPVAAGPASVGQTDVDPRRLAGAEARHTRRPELGEVLVDVAVAVVVGVVAPLGRAHAGRLAAVGGVVIGVHPAEVAGADAAAPVDAGRCRVGGRALVPAGPAVAGIGEQIGLFVDARVAVVVEAVAGLDAAVRHVARILAARRDVAVDVAKPRIAAAHYAAARLAAEGAVGETPAIVLTGATVHRVLVQRLVVLVHRAVAVVVGVVTEFDAALGDTARRLAAGLHVAVEVVKPRFAAQDPALSGLAVRPGVREVAGTPAGPAVSRVGLFVDVLVGRAVAVLVQAVAGVSLGPQGHALAAVGCTRVEVHGVAEALFDDTGPVGADGGGVGQMTGMPVIELLVDHPVAVVVEPVASLVATRHAGAPHAVGAHAEAVRADALGLDAGPRLAVDADRRRGRQELDHDGFARRGLVGELPVLGRLAERRPERRPHRPSDCATRAGR
jgi:hypothetical protein